MVPRAKTGPVSQVLHIEPSVSMPPVACIFAFIRISKIAGNIFLRISLSKLSRQANGRQSSSRQGKDPIMNAKPQFEMTKIREVDTLLAENQPHTSSEMRDRKVYRAGTDRQVAIRVYFEVSGCGSFRAGPFDTNQCVHSAWLKPHSVLALDARPGPGYRFSHWVIDNEYSGSSRRRRIKTSRGMTIRAVFVRRRNDSIRG